MNCSRCDKPGVHRLPNMTLCKDHFIEYFEKKVYKTIKKFELIKEHDKVCVATSGGKDSLAVLYTTLDYCKRHNVEIFALAIDEGIAGYRDKTLDDLNDFCQKHEVKLETVSFKDDFGDTLDNIRQKALDEQGKKPCTVCGVFRRTLLNKYAKKFNATKLVTGHNLDDEAQAYMMNLVLGNMSHNAKLGPMTGYQEDSEFVPRIKPLYFIQEKETRLYALLKGFKVEFSECPNIHQSFRAVVRDQLNEIEEQRMGSKNGIVNAFLEILPMLKEKYRTEKQFTHCKKCGSPSSRDICNSCKLQEELGLDN